MSPDIWGKTDPAGPDTDLSAHHPTQQATPPPPDPASMPTPPEGLRLWSCQGVTLDSGDGPPGSGVVTVEQLEIFIAWVRGRMPGATILTHRFGLRAVRYDGDSEGGPRLDWRDWD